MRKSTSWVEVQRGNPAWPLFDQYGKPLLPCDVIRWLQSNRIKASPIPQGLTDGDIFRYCEVLCVNGRAFYRFSSPRLAVLFKMVWG